MPQASVFSNDEIHKAINEMMQSDISLPANKKVGFFSIIDGSGARAVTAVRIGENWHIQAEVKHPWSGGLSYGIELKGLI